MRKFLTLLSMLMLFAAFAVAQTRQVTGKVTNDKGEPIPFATVSIKGTKTTSVADANGNFSIDAKTGDVLQISSAGIASKDVVVGASGAINVSVVAASGTMEEVVVTAQGIRRRPKETWILCSQGFKPGYFCRPFAPVSSEFIW